jgi:3-phosphoshikimate 1-carboxyvinyltransferase
VRVRVYPSVARGLARAPPSKSYTHRAILAGYLSGRYSRVIQPLDSEDTRATAHGIAALGADVRFGASAWTVRPSRTPVSRRSTTIRCGRSGTTLRFLLAVAAREDRAIRFVGDPELARRPIEPLLRALAQRGATVDRAPRGRSLPTVIRGPIVGGDVRLDPALSSQFLSGLLFVLPTLAAPSRVRLARALPSAPYVEATLSCLRSQGISVSRRGRTYRVPGSQRGRGGRIEVPGDASSAAYLWAAAAVSGGEVVVEGVWPRWPQADLLILPVLRDAGVHVSVRSDRVTVRGRVTRPIAADLDGAPDLLPLLGAVAAVTPGRHRLEGAAHAARKESDRRRETARLVRALGGTADLRRRSLTIRGSSTPRALPGIVWDDHRLVMSAVVGALSAPGPSTVGDPRAVRKSFPGFWETCSRLGIRWEPSK